MDRKRLTWIGITILLLGLMISQAAVAQLKIGYINSQKMLLSFPKAVEAQQQLQRELNAVDLEMKQMEQDLVALQQAFNQQSLLLSEQNKQEKQQEMQDLYVRIQQYRQEKQTELSQRQDELMKPILEELDKGNISAEEAMEKLKES